VQAASGGAGRGSRTVNVLPRIVAPAAPPAPAPARFAGAPRRILVVEDNADAREVLVSALRLDGHEMHEASDGQAGLEIALRLVPDVALIDVGLPGLDGYQVAQRIRASEAGATMLLVALTGYGQADDRRRALAAGFDVHLVKPVESERIAEVLRSARSATRRSR
jgi:two-component system, sensor histidine kinase